MGDGSLYCGFRESREGTTILNRDFLEARFRKGVKDHRRREVRDTGMA